MTYLYFYEYLIPYGFSHDKIHMLYLVMMLG